MVSWDDSVFPHGPFQKLHQRLWLVTGQLPYSSIPRNMVIYQLDSGELLLHSVIALDKNGMAELERLGQPAYMIIPNRFHRLDAKVYQERYPAIKVLCPKNTRVAAESIVDLYGTCEEILPKLGIDFFAPEGSKNFELIYKLKLEEGCALLMSDLMFNLKHQIGLEGLLLKVFGSTGFFGTTPIGRMLIIRNRKVFKNSLHQYVSRLKNVKVVCVSHGDPIFENCQPRLIEAVQRI